MKIRGTGAQRLVEDVIAAFERGGILLPVTIGFPSVAKTLHYTLFHNSHRTVCYATVNRVQELTVTAGWESYGPAREIVVDLIGWGLEAHFGFPGDVVEPAVKED